MDHVRAKARECFAHSAPLRPIGARRKRGGTHVYAIQPELANNGMVRVAPFIQHGQHSNAVAALPLSDREAVDHTFQPAELGRCQHVEDPKWAD
jgi:hypothetical protein